VFQNFVVLLIQKPGIFMKRESNMFSTVTETGLHVVSNPVEQRKSGKAERN
jgi:hypothetical protein